MNPCNVPATAHIRKYLAYLKHQVNAASYYPPSYGYKYSVALVLFSKAITTADATLVLLDAGYTDEAFGMTRTLIDIFITLRHIAIKDTDERAKRYARFAAKQVVELAERVPDYWPEMPFPTVEPSLQQIADTYDSHYKWSGKDARQMIEEPDPKEIDPATSKPGKHHFHYRIMFFLTSQYVHPTVTSLDNHLVQAGHDPFQVRSGRNPRDMSFLAVFNVAVYTADVAVYFYRIMDDPQPRHLSAYTMALLGHLGVHDIRQHKRVRVHVKAGAPR